MKGGGRRGEGWGWGGRVRERSCQGNVYPCHSSQKSAMDEWITAISDCQGESSVRFDVCCGQNGSHATECTNGRISKDAVFGLTFMSCFACVRIAFVYTGMFRLFSRWNTVHCAQTRAGTHTNTGKFPARPCRQSFRAMAAGLLCVFLCVCVVFGYSLAIGAAPSYGCLSFSVPSSHHIIVSLLFSLSLAIFQAVPSSPTVPESRPWKPRMHCTSRRPCQG